LVRAKISLATDFIVPVNISPPSSAIVLENLKLDSVSG
jgi:hypothetical protein